MKTFLHQAIALALCLTFSGCLSVKDNTYRYDRESGLFEVIFHDIRSVKPSDPQDKQDYVSKDWADLKAVLNKTDDFDPKIIKIISKDIFQEGNSLSGKLVYQVICPSCFGNPTDILKILNSDGRWEEVNKEILLFFERGKQVVSTNGKLIQTHSNTICIWPANAKVFEFTLSYDNPKGVSLLNQYLLEKNTTSSQSPVGLWKTFDDQTGNESGLVRIYEQDGKLFGKLEHSFTPGDDESVCSKCQDERKDQSIAGLVIIRNMKWLDGYYGGGDILDPENGTVYRAKFHLNEDGSRLDVHGYVGAPIFGRTQIWQRQK